MTAAAPITVMLGEHSGRRSGRLPRLGWGRCFVERLAPHKATRPYAGEPWFFDNGAFRWFKAGLPFQGQTFRERLDGIRALDLEPPVFAVIPDIVAGGLESLAFSLEWLDSGDLEPTWRWYLAVQDGMTVDDVEPVIARDDVAGLFVGGSDAFKATAASWAALAHRYGKACHYGRASGLARLREAMAAGCDSCDTAAILFSDLQYFRFAQVWAAESGVELDAETRAWIDAGVEAGRAADRERRAMRRAA